MTVSTANIIAQNQETGGWDNLYPLAGSIANIFWNDPTSDIRWGILRGKFTINFEKIVLKFSNLTPTIPKNAKIVSAVIRGAAFATTDAQSFLTLIQILAADGFWDPVSVGPSWRSASAVGTLTDCDVALFNTAAVSQLDTAVAVDRVWPLRATAAGRATKGGQGVVTGTAFTLGFADINIDRTGVVAVGNIWAEIYSVDGAGLADTLLATSDTRPASDAAGAGARLRFTFSGAEQIAIAISTGYAVVLNGDYPVSATQYVGIRYARAGYGFGTFQLFGTGVDFDDQNYPMQDSFRTIPVSPNTGFVVWIAPKFFVGVDYDTPDLTFMLQTHIQQSAYVQGDPLAFTLFYTPFLFPASGTALRQWAQFGHATLPSIRLIVEWRERGIRVAG